MLDRKRKRGERKGNYEYISIIEFILFSATYGQVGKGLIMKDWSLSKHNHIYRCVELKYLELDFGGAPARELSNLTSPEGS